MSRQPLTNKEWFDRAERGTSGDQVHDILYDWKANLAELEARNAELESKISEFIYGEDNPNWISPDKAKINELQAVVDAAHLYSSPHTRLGAVAQLKHIHTQTAKHATLEGE